MENRGTKCNYQSKSLINLAFAKEDSEDYFIKSNGKIIVDIP
jgi:hypothetical protein